MIHTSSDYKYIAVVNGNSGINFLCFSKHKINPNTNIFYVGSEIFSITGDTLSQLHTYYNF